MTIADPQLLDVLFSLRAATQTVMRITAPYGVQDIRDELVQLGVTKAVEWVGEISGRILRKWPDFAADHPELQLAAAYRARNRLSHGYDTVDFDVLWTMATVSVPAMNEVLVALLAELAPDDRP